MIDYSINDVIGGAFATTFLDAVTKWVAYTIGAGNVTINVTHTTDFADTGCDIWP